MWYVYYNAEDELVLYEETLEWENGGIYYYKFLRENRMSTDCVGYYHILNPEGLNDGDNFNDEQVQIVYQYSTIAGGWADYSPRVNKHNFIQTKFNRAMAKILR